MNLFEENIINGSKPTIDYSKKYSTVGKLVLDNLKLYDDRDCIIDAVSKEKITYKQLIQQTVKVAEVLKSLGITKQDVLAISSENNVNFYIPFIAALYLGVPVAPLNHNYINKELNHAINISKPSIIFCSAKIVEKYIEIRKSNSFIKYIVTLETGVKIKDVENLEEFKKKYPDDIDHLNYQVENFDANNTIAVILTSSGTTGLPKGVAISHYNCLIELSILDEPLYGNNHDSILGVLPFFHAYGLFYLLASINRGTMVVVLKKFELDNFLKTIEEYKISKISLVPPIIIALLKSPLLSKYNLSSLKEINVGAAPLGKDIEETIRRRFRVENMLQGYGLSEATLSLTKTPLGEYRSGSSGKLVPHMQAKVCDLETGKSLGVRQKGELCFKGPLIMKGYYKNVEATKLTIDEDGWLHTGDVGYYDEDGYFYIVDRIKELIKYKGYQVAPAELEALLINHPCIKDAAVIGKSDDVAGELPLAFIVREQGGKNVGKDEIMQYIAKQVSPQKRLRGGIIFIDEIPKNPSGKILRRKLREMIRQKSKL